MKKILLVGLLFLTGCSVNYKMEFIDESINESIEFNNITSAQLEALKQDTRYAIFNIYEQYPYNTDFQELINKATYSYTYSVDNFKNALYLNDCFDASSFAKQQDNYILSTSKGFKCMSLDYYFADEVQIQISTNHNVIENNADEIKNDKYIWLINNDNADTKQIYIKFGDIKEMSIIEKIKHFIMDNLLAISIFGSLFVIIIVVIISIVIISKKNNEI